jgi:hypothetical protein
MKRALLLNADWTPMHFVDEDETIYLLYTEKAEMVVMDHGNPSQWPEGHRLVSGGFFPAGATIRLKKWAKKKWKLPRFRKKVLFNRDDWRCQYCNCEVTPNSATVEHILPESRGGATSWLNCCTACHECNKRKRNMTPEEAGMPLLRKPTTPQPVHFWDLQRSRQMHPDWEVFLSNI